MDVQAAHELGMPTPAGSPALKLELSQIMDACAGNEYALPTLHHRDVIEFAAARAATALCRSRMADDPRNDILATRSTAAVMKNGRICDAATLAENWPRQRASPPARFDNERPRRR